MGNTIPVLKTAPLDARSCIQKLPGSKIVQQHLLHNRRFMKTFHSKRDGENLVVKVYYHSHSGDGDHYNTNDDDYDYDHYSANKVPEELTETLKILLEQRTKFSRNSSTFNVIPYQSCNYLGDLNTAFLIRQHFRFNLHDTLFHR